MLKWGSDAELNIERESSSFPSEDDDDSFLATEPKIPHHEAIKSLNITLTWAEQNNIELADISCVRKLREKAVIKSLNLTKQSSITSFFPKN